VNYYRGVPGLDKIRVILEDDGAMVEVKKSDAVRVSDLELEQRPYAGLIAEAKTACSSEPSVVTYFGTMVTTESSSTSAAVLKQEVSVALIPQSNLSTATKNNTSKTASVAMEPTLKRWLWPGIKVRIVSKKVKDGRVYLKKGTVIEVFEGGDVGSIQLEETGVVIEGVRARYVETVMPVVGGVGLVLSGSCKGLMATLVEKHKESNEVSVHLVEELMVLRVSMDEFAAVIG
jgi:hypothetical protein